MSRQEPVFVSIFSARFTWLDASRGLQRTTWVLEGVDAARSEPAARTAAPISTMTTNDARDGIGLNVGARPRPGYRDEHVRSGDIAERWPTRHSSNAARRDGRFNPNERARRRSAVAGRERL